MTKSMRVGFGAAYVAAIHILVALLLYKSDAIVLIEKNLGFATPKSVYFHREMTEYQDRLDATLSPGSVIFIGASHTQSLDVAAITDHAVNYGIGGDAIADVMDRLPNYHSLSQARAIVLEVGYNDLRYHSLPRIVADYRRLLAALPDKAPLVLS